MASLTPVSGMGTSLLLVPREMLRMSARLEKSKKASGTTQVRRSLSNSRPMGQAQVRPWGRWKHRWLQPPLFSAQPLVPEHTQMEIYASAWWTCIDLSDILKLFETLLLAEAGRVSFFYRLFINEINITQYCLQHQIINIYNKQLFISVILVSFIL